MTSAEIRQQFIDFFKSKEHTFVTSAPVVPMDDPTLLFTNAGMNQFKDLFLGTGSREYTRATNSQKCIRVSGKHNDLEEVGPSPNHHTFFEMLGNWSFGDYYKREAIQWAWELFTEVWGFDKSKLYATVFTDDDEAFDIWKEVFDGDESHISRHGHKDNFWEMGEVGPCGPCTEIHYDLGKPAPGRSAIENDGPNTESGRFIELWNLVFIQYHRDEQGELHDLPSKHVDTGAGLERIVRVLNGVDSNYETDLFKPLIDKIAAESGVPYVPPSEGGKESQYIPHRAIADHLRMLSFAIADGALPGNEGRGYVLRRVLRRAARFIRELGLEAPFLPMLVPTLVEVMGGHFTELKQRQQHIEAVLKAEEEAFARTLDNGIERVFDFYWLILMESFEHNKDFVKSWAKNNLDNLDRIGKHVNKNEDFNILDYEIDRFKHILNDPTDGGEIELFDRTIVETGWIIENYSDRKDEDLDQLYSIRKIYVGKVIAGEKAFELYDTYGFPLDLTEQMARERGISVDVEGFHAEMEKAKEKSRAAGNFKASGGEFTVVTEMQKHSQFTGYDSLKEATRIHLVREIDTAGSSCDVGGAGKSGRGFVPRVFAVVLEKTPFYAESGGQVTDHGFIRSEGLELKVYDVRQEGDRRVHYCETVTDLKGDKWPTSVMAEVDEHRRRRIEPHHTTTHLVQKALQNLLGDHISQAGSMVSPDRMTFDFTHVEKLTDEQIAKAENWVNARIREDWPVTAHEMGIAEAKAKGAMALFGEKYGEVVRAIVIGESPENKVSMELCGGTHVRRTGEIGLFRIESETGVSAGVRRITCTAGEAAWERTVEERRELRVMTGLVGAQGSSGTEKLEKLLEEQKRLEKEVERLKKAALQGAVNFLEEWGREIEVAGESALLVSGIYEIAGDREGLHAAGDKIVEDLKKAGREGIGIVGNDIEDSFLFVCVVTPGLIKKGVAAGKLVGHVAKKAGGGGGGKPDFATAGSKEVQKAKSLLADKVQVDNAVKEYLEK